jgi:hypothetical protein
MVSTKKIPTNTYQKYQIDYTYCTWAGGTCFCCLRKVPLSSPCSTNDVHKSGQKKRISNFLQIFLMNPNFLLEHRNSYVILPFAFVKTLFYSVTLSTVPSCKHSFTLYPSLTDPQTEDELILVGLGNLTRFLQVHSLSTRLLYLYLPYLLFNKNLCTWEFIDTDRQNGNYVYI